MRIGVQGSRATLVLALLGLLVPFAWGQETPPPQPETPQTPPPEVPSTPPAEPAAAPNEPRVLEFGKSYHFLEDKAALLEAWQASGLVETLELGSSWGGRELFAIQFGAQGTSLSERTTIFLVGGLDGVSQSGSEAVLSVVSELLALPERLPNDVTFVAIPWANPDGLARWRSSGIGGGCNDRPIDNDGDGQVDEDPPDDLDRDGMVLEMLVEDPDGPWAQCNDDRFLRPAREGEAPRFLCVPEGRDDDGDGRYNEDGPGGVQLDHNFPVGWDQFHGPEAGPWPLSEPDSKALAELMMVRRTAVVIAFQGNHGTLAKPGGVSGVESAWPEDDPTYRKIAEVFCGHTGRTQARAPTLAEARGGNWPGSLVDWAYTALGALAMEIAVWGPSVEVNATAPVDAQFSEQGRALDPAPGELPLEEEAWARWLDDARAGRGFMHWQPTELPGVRIGGWERDTRVNPPLDALPRALHGLAGFVLDLATNLPRLEVEVRSNLPLSKLTQVRARVRNHGMLPSGVGPGGQGMAVRLRIELTRGVTLAGGQAESVIGHLPGRGSSQEYGWLFVAPEGSPVFLTVESAWSAPVRREVRL
jgi:hypothetical protein